MSDNLYESIKNQNLTLQNYMNKSKDIYSLENNQFKAKEEKKPILKYTYYVLFVLYIVVFILFTIIIIINPILSWYIKTILILVFLIYPFFIYTFENSLYQMFYYAYAVFMGESYYNIMNRKSIQNPKNYPDISKMISGIKSNVKKLENEFVKVNYDVIFNNLNILLPKLLDITKTNTEKLKSYLKNNIPDNTFQKINYEIDNFKNTMNSSIKKFENTVKNIPSNTKQSSKDLLETIFKFEFDAEEFIQKLDKKINEKMKDLDNYDKLKDSVKDQISKIEEDILSKINNITINQKDTIGKNLDNIEETIKKSIVKIQNIIHDKSKSIPIEIHNLIQENQIAIFNDLLLYKSKIVNSTNYNKIKSEVDSFVEFINKKMDNFKGILIPNVGKLENSADLIKKTNNIFEDLQKEIDKIAKSIKY